MKFYNVLRLAGLLVFMALAGCANAPKTTAGFRTEISASQGIQITAASARVEPYGLVVTGRVHIPPYVPATNVHSVDIVISGPDRPVIQKFTSQYFPTPKAGKRKAQHAQFTMVTYSVPPEGSVIQVSLTPEPKPEQPEQSTLEKQAALPAQ